MDGILGEAYERLHCTGPEWGEDGLTNHGPMAVEVLVRRGHSTAVAPWVSRYMRRLDDLPAAGERITERTWSSALGNGRIGDWTDYFAHQITEHPWRELLRLWWPRLLPGLLAGATHGVIRVGHVVRGLLAGGEANPATLNELGHGLAFWAARACPLPFTAEPGGELDPGAALDRVPRIPDQVGTIADRFGRFDGVPGLPTSMAALRPAADPAEVRDRLADLVYAASVRYATHGHGQPVLLVHAATAPNAVLHTLPALPTELWAPSLTAVWTVSAALFAAYAPAAGIPRAQLPASASHPDAAADAIDRAVRHGDEHVIKFTDTAVDAYTRTGDRHTLVAADRIRMLIPPP